MKSLGIIDIGSNSIKLLIVNTYKDKYYNVAYQEKMPIRLSSYLSKSNSLTEEGFDLLKDILTYFNDICLAHNTYKIISVATETIRRMSNSENIINKIKDIVGIEISILAGKEEAYFGYLSSLYNINLSDYLQIDIGGSSMEIVLVKGKKLINSISLPLGAIPITRKFNMDKIISKNEEDDFRDFIFDELDKLGWLKEAKHLPLIGIGGSVRTIAKIHRNRENYPIKLQHNYSLEYDDVDEICSFISQLELAQRVSVKGLPKERADIFLGCASSVKYIMQYISCNELIISKYGIREGLVINELNSKNESIIDNSLNSILFNNNLDINYYNKLSTLAIDIANNLNISYDNINSIIKTSCKLHDLGKTISTNSKLRHSFYFILNTQINGLSHKEQLLSAYVVKFMDKNNYKINSEHNKLISKSEIDICKKISLIIQLVTLLNMYHQELENIVISKDKVELIYNSSIPLVYRNKIDILSDFFIEVYNIKIDITINALTIS